MWKGVRKICQGDPHLAQQVFYVKLLFWINIRHKTIIKTTLCCRMFIFDEKVYIDDGSRNDRISFKILFFLSFFCQ